MCIPILTLIYIFLKRKIEKDGKIYSSLSELVEALTEEMSTSDEEETQQPGANGRTFNQFPRSHEFWNLKKSNLHSTGDIGDITPKRVTSGGFVSAACRLGDTAPKKRSVGEPLATSCPI